MKFMLDSADVHFVGAFSVVSDTKVFGPDEFHIDTVEDVSEKEALGRILVHVKGSAWEQRVREHYASL